MDDARGIVLGIMMPISGRMADRYGPRWLASIGTAITGLSMLVYGALDPLSGATMIIGPQIVRAVGLAFMMAPLITAAVNSVPLEKVAMASSFLNVSQRVGGSFGIALLNIYVTNSITGHSMRISELMGMRSETFHHFAIQVSNTIARYAQGMPSSDSAREQIISIMLRHVPGVPSTEHAQGLMISLQMILKKATVMGFENGFVVGGLIVLIGVPLCLMLKKTGTGQSISSPLSNQQPPVKRVA